MATRNHVFWVACLVVSIGGTVAIYYRSTSSPKSIAGNRIDHVVPSSGPSSTGVVASKSDPIAINPIPGPTFIEMLRSLSESQQLDLLQKMRADLKLGDSQIEYLCEVVREKSFSALVRNQTANILVAQAEQPHGLSNIFTSIIEDDSEDPVFRDYSIQFLGVLAERSQNREDLVRKLLTIVRQGDPALSGTAVLHLARLQSLGFIPKNLVAVPELIALAARAEASEIGLMGVLSALAETHDPVALDVVRSHVADSRSCIRRVAIAAMAQSPVKEDRAMLESYVHDSDPLVALASKNALARIDASQESSP